MKKKIIICSAIFVLIMLIASTAFATDLSNHTWNGNCVHYFTTNAYVDNYSVSEGRPVHVWQSACYYTYYGYPIDTNSQIYMVRSGSLASEKIVTESTEIGYNIYPTLSGDLHMRIYNYYHYEDGFSIHSEGEFQQQ